MTTHNEHNAIIADKPTIKLINQLRKIRTIKKKLEGKEKTLKEALLFECEDNEAICNEDGIVLVTCKKTVTNRFDTESFKDGYPDMYQMYLKKTESRTLLIKE